MTLIRIENVSLTFGQTNILNKINMQIDPFDKIFLIGRNGMGKSCLLKIITGQIEVDSGKIHFQPGLKIATLAQDLPSNSTLTVFEFVAQGLEKLGNLLKRYQELTNSTTHDDKWYSDIEDVQRQLELNDGWQYQQTIEDVLTRLDLPADKPLNELSGGWQRRAALAKALVSQPDILLLDEPTNHLDISAIEWLEEYLTQFNGALLCISHDRALLRKLSKRIIELDRGNLTLFNGNFDEYLVKKTELLEIESKQDKLFDKVLAREEAWIRQGVKARRTRNEGRVRSLEKLRNERTKRREVQGKPNFTLSQYITSGDLVINAENVNFKFGDQTIIRYFSTKIFKGDKIALLGPNGAGKSTLLKLLLGQLQPTSGEIKQGTNLQIGYFDQLRAGINFELSAIDNVAGGREFITVAGGQKHIIGYLGDFLFTPERARIPVRMLSGGECNRLLLAKLFSVSTNLLILDEPTNDLDIESLELLEEILIDYPGTLLLVSHDRAFIDCVATSTLCFRGKGMIDEYVGGFKDIPVINTKKDKVTDRPEDKSSNKPVKNTQAFNSQMKKELAELPGLIAELEKKITSLQLEVASADFMHKDKAYIKETLSKLGNLDKKLQQSYARWEELEEIKAGSN